MLAQANAVRIPLPGQSVHCAVTSPPYWGLRKYAGEQGEEPLGLEATPERHIERIVKICREVRRVLRDDGVFWLNYGDCYSAAGWESNRRSVVGQGSFDPAERKSGKSPGTRAGSLMMMPHRVALALQQDGWIIRQDLVWYKRNPMPESVNGWRWQREREKKGRSEHARKHNIKGGTEAMLRDASIHKGIGPDWVPKYVDCPGCEKCIPNDGLVLKRGSWRHTRAHEYVFMLVKRMQYWSNQEAVRESNRSTAEEYNRGAKAAREKRAKHQPGVEGLTISGGLETRFSNPQNPSGRNPRSVLDVPTAPYKGAHYATYPPNLIAPLIRATCPRWACPRCGQGWAAVVGKGSFEKQDGARMDEWNYGKHDTPSVDGGKSEQLRESGFTPNHSYSKSVLGYRPTCEHEHTQEEAVPGIVFDPFVGSGTTVAVAKSLLRQGIGIDISMEYLDHQAKIRTGEGMPSNALEDLPLFADML